MAVRSPLRYPGGKWKAMPQILPLIPDNIEDWREPFFGGGSVTLFYLQSHKNTAKRVIVGDLSPEIWAFWQGTKLHAEEAKAIVAEWFNRNAPTQSIFSRTDITDPDYVAIETQALAEGAELWKKLTTIDCSQLSLAERAARTFLVNRISFSGMGDSGTLSKDQFKDFKPSDAHRLVEVSEVLKPVEILHASFEETMANPDKNKTFIFLDPPYFAQEKSGLYGKGGDTHRGFPHQGLADLCRSLECKWLMTYDDSPRVRRLYKGMYIKEFYIPYTMAGKTAEDALAGEELFLANYDICDSGTFEELSDII